ncbi:MAG: hypothetical protein DRO39_07730 [Thermoprotei archaeon]|nr:MAG: hypothetical protein DRO39_07730 [Thermoprotei archaeon]
MMRLADYSRRAIRVAADVYAFRELWGRDPPTPSEFYATKYSPEGWGYTVLATFAKMIIAYRSIDKLENLGIVIDGKRGVGKTTYAVNALYTVCMEISRLSGAEVDCRREVLRNTFWYLDEALARLGELSEVGGWVPFVVLDDVGVHGSKYWFLSRRKRIRMISFFELVDMLKDVVGLVIMTTPYVEKMARTLREIADYHARIEQIVEGGRVVNRVKWSRIVSRDSTRRARSVRRWIYVEWLPPDVRMLESVWSRMMEVRKEVLREKIEEFLRGGEEEDAGPEGGS